MCVHAVSLLFVMCLVMQFDWVYVTGDLSPHIVWNQTREDTQSLTLPPPSPDLVLWCLHAGPSAEGHLASLPQLNQSYYPNQIKKVAPFDYCLANLSTPIGEFHVGSVWLS